MNETEIIDVDEFSATTNSKNPVIDFVTTNYEETVTVVADDKYSTSKGCFNTQLGLTSTDCDQNTISPPSKPIATIQLKNSMLTDGVDDMNLYHAKARGKELNTTSICSKSSSDSDNFSECITDGSVHTTLSPAKAPVKATDRNNDEMVNTNLSPTKAPVKAPGIAVLHSKSSSVYKHNSKYIIEGSVDMKSFPAKAPSEAYDCIDEASITTNPTPDTLPAKAHVKAPGIIVIHPKFTIAMDANTIHSKLSSDNDNIIECINDVSDDTSSSPAVVPAKVPNKKTIYSKSSIACNNKYECIIQENVDISISPAKKPSKSIIDTTNLDIAVSHVGREKYGDIVIIIDKTYMSSSVISHRLTPLKSTNGRYRIIFLYANIPTSTIKPRVHSSTTLPANGLTRNLKN